MSLSFLLSNPYFFVVFSLVPLCPFGSFLPPLFSLYFTVCYSALKLCTLRLFLLFSLFSWLSFFWISLLCHWHILPHAGKPNSSIPPASPILPQVLNPHTWPMCAAHLHAWIYTHFNEQNYFVFFSLQAWRGWRSSFLLTPISRSQRHLSPEKYGTIFPPLSFSLGLRLRQGENQSWSNCRIN